MANVLNNNTFYIDTAFASSADDLVRKNALVAYIIVTATAASGRIVLSDVGASPDLKLDLRVATSGATQEFSFVDNPVVFPNGIRVSTLSNAIATVVLRNPGG